MGYFRKIFEEQPDLLRQRSNDPISERWLADNPGHTELPKTVRNTLANLKSTLRKKAKIRKKRKQNVNGQVPTPAASMAPVRGGHASSLETLEQQIDDVLDFARSLDKEGLSSIIRLLRHARNEVVWKIGQ